MSGASTDQSVRKRLFQAFDTNEKKLRLALDEARSNFNHSGIKGDVVEEAVRSFLAAHLPRVFGVGTGEVIDRLGHRSPQLDVIVTNEDQPFVHPRDTAGLYLAEGVSAVGEVKSVLNTAAMDDILRKGAAVRALRPTPNAGDEVRSNPTDIERYVMSVPQFAIAITSTMSIDAITSALSAAPLVPSPDGSILLPPIDLLVVLEPKLVAMFTIEGGDAHLVNDVGVETFGWGRLNSDRPLTELFLWLNGNASRVRRWQSIAVPYLLPSSPEEARSWNQSDAEAQPLP